MKEFNKWWDNDGYDWNYREQKEAWIAALKWVLSIKTEPNKDIKFEDGFILRDLRTEWTKRCHIIEKELEDLSYKTMRDGDKDYIEYKELVKQELGET